MELKIRKAESKDIKKIMDLLRQVNDVHADGRPDLFRHGCTKYTSEELSEIIADPCTPVFVATDGNEEVTGYCFGIFQDHSGSNNLTDVKTLYIDDICVDEHRRGQGIGLKIYEFVKNYAKAMGVYNLTLNVWSCNPVALRFYETLGMRPMKIGMEEILR